MYKYYNTEKKCFEKRVLSSWLTQKGGTPILSKDYLGKNRCQLQLPCVQMRQSPPHLDHILSFFYVKINLRNKQVKLILS